MKTVYKGFEIEVNREKCLAGWDMLYFNVYSPEGSEIICSFEDSEETVREKVKHMKEAVDDYLENPEDWE